MVMNRERVKELLPVFEAFVDGKAIQFRLSGDSEWLDMPIDEQLVLTFPATDYEYRVKPKEPREFWINTETMKAYMPGATLQNGKHIKVREVL